MPHSTWSSKGGKILLLLVLSAGADRRAGAQQTLPDSPQPQPDFVPTLTAQSADNSDRPPIPAGASPSPVFPPVLPSSLSLMGVSVCPPNTCSAAGLRMTCLPDWSPFRQFLKRSGPRPLTARDKLLLAGRHIIDPFNLLTVVGTSALEVASNPDTVYGPGMPGFARDMGVSFTQDLTDEFFGTFLIPSITHQDPHYHRMPNASIQRRVAHAIYQVVWTQSDTGRPMFNYATVAGTLADDLVSDLYVPGRRHNASATAARVSTALATDPIDNFVTEFLPDLARHVNIRVAFVQRIINRVALDENATRF